jgi:hypothetical protein
LQAADPGEAPPRLSLGPRIELPAWPCDHLAVTAATLSRRLEPDGTVVLADDRCAFRYSRPRPGVLEIRIAGSDAGQFGTATLDEIAMALVRERPLELFVDAAEASMPAVPVSQAWTRFIALNQKDLSRVSVLVSSKSVALTMAIAQHLSNTGKLMQIYSDRELYDKARGG